MYRMHRHLLAGVAVLALGVCALVAGTAVFKDGPARYAANIEALRS